MDNATWLIFKAKSDLCEKCISSQGFSHLYLFEPDCFVSVLSQQTQPPLQNAKKSISISQHLFLNGFYLNGFSSPLAPQAMCSHSEGKIQPVPTRSILKLSRSVQGGRCIPTPPLSESIWNTAIHCSISYIAAPIVTNAHAFVHSIRFLA
uniref:Ovule protein n=1 Tax=Ascaris lumbricoides TaxID=6252 RepID=A0A0M3HWX0_ASCLU